MSLPSSPPLAAGTYLGTSLRLLEVLGSGGMGVVYRARDEALARDVAVKVVDPARVADPATRARFLEEARAMARVRHPSVVEIFNFGDHDGAPYFVMEYVDGTTLEEWLRRREEPIELGAVLKILDGVALALRAIHGTGTVHGDLKPANVLLTQDFRVRLADFGLATDLTSDLELVGTPAYLSPERIRGDAVPPPLRPRGDMYAFGVLAYQLLTRTLPFDAPDVARVYAQHLHKAPPSLLRTRPDLGARVDLAWQAMLAKDPAMRSESPEELLRALRLVDPGTPHVLVVDDDPDFRELARACIEEELEPCVVVESDGSDALFLLGEQRFQLVVLDLHMPEMDGKQLTAAIRARHAPEQLKILVITGQGSADDWRQLRDLGADAFAVKPLEPVTFASAAKRLIEKKKAA
ncbi:MAG: protein kinase [Sandaracinus sp.]|nr:protein kinase [Sandaracinus sp.]